MWQQLATVEATLDCIKPFSFYFDLVTPYFKSRAQDSNPIPLHRLCTLARKQGAIHVVVEDALSRADVREDIDSLDATYSGDGAAEAIALSFFAGPADNFSVAATEDRWFLGHAVVINYRPPGEAEFKTSYVYEAILKPPRLNADTDTPRPLLNSFLGPASEFECRVQGRTFDIEGFYYCQQNIRSHVCAHASLRMILRSKHNPHLTSSYINSKLGLTPPLYGLKISEIVDVLSDAGYESEVIDCHQLDAEPYSTILASILESGDRALLVFTTVQPGASSQHHVVAIFGHTRNLDEWHPEAVPLYGGPGSSEYYRASNWIDHYIIHDDNLGPYYTLNNRALEADPDVRAQWIVGVRKKATERTALGAEAVAWIALSALLPSLGGHAGSRWLDYIRGAPVGYVLRNILLTRDEYVEHLRTAEGHDGSRMQAAELSRLASLPERFWMVEFTFPALLTGNRSKLGEVLVSAEASGSPPKVWEDTFALRVPGFLFLVSDPAQPALKEYSSGLTAHSPIFRYGQHDHVW
jgi:hypothetical protein